MSDLSFQTLVVISLHLSTFMYSATLLASFFKVGKGMSAAYCSMSHQLVRCCQRNPSRTMYVRKTQPHSCGSTAGLVPSTRESRVFRPLTCGISSLLHSVNLIVFTVLLVHLILCISPHHSHHLRSHHLSLFLCLFSFSQMKQCAKLDVSSLSSSDVSFSRMLKIWG